jgi:hopanoid biosynthesis associated protein HpnK
MLEHLLSRWGYLTIAFGTFIEGEAVLLAAGALAHAGSLSLPFVVLAGAVGSVVWGQTWYQVGRSSGKRLLAGRPNWRARAARVERWLSSSGLWILLGGRFLAGLGTVLPAMIGASGFPRRRFVVLDTLGALLWSSVFASGGFAVGAGLKRLIGHAPGWPWLALAGAGAAGLVWLASRLAGSLRKPDPAPANGAFAEPDPSKRVIITADDFGLAVPVNEAVELGYQQGVLTTTSLLIGELASADAVVRACRNAELRVGLHVALCDGRPTLPPSEIPLLVNRRGELLHPIVALIRFTFLAAWPALRRQIEAEIRAQFQAFRRTGLSLDHVNGHNNMQLHPLVLPILLTVAREHGALAIRLPYEPLLPSWRASGRRQFFLRLLVWLVMCPWCAYVKGRFLREGFVVNDYLFGLFDCGAMNRKLLESTISSLPAGLSEIHCHPATRRCPELDKNMPSYAHAAELAALVDPAIRAALVKAGVRSLSGFGGVSSEAERS